MNPVEVTVFARLECCVPDFTGKNKILARVLSGAKEALGERARIEVVANSTRPERLAYYKRMTDALITGGHSIPFGMDRAKLEKYHRLMDALDYGGFPFQPTPELRQLAYYLFSVTPVISIDGKAVYVGTVPSVIELVEAVDKAFQTRDPMGGEKVKNHESCENRENYK